MAATLLSPLSSQDMDAALAQAADTVMRGLTQLREMSGYYGTALTQDNLDGGMLVVLGGPEPRPLTAEELARYQLYFAQVGDIARYWSEASPPADGIVAPWWQQFRSTGKIPGMP